MHLDAKHYSSYLESEEAQVTPSADLKVQLHDRLFTSAPKRSFRLLPALALVVIIVMVIVARDAFMPQVVMSPGPLLYSSGEESVEEYTMADGAIRAVEDDEDGAAVSSSTATDGAEDVLIDATMDGEPLLTDGDGIIPGFRGSYCDEHMCVDIFPLWDRDAVRFAGVSLPLTLQLPRAATNVQFGLRDEEGEWLRCVVGSEVVNDTTYRIDSCGEVGRHYYLDVGIFWADGGDASYVYPITVE